MLPILVDCDGVLADLVSPVLQLARVQAQIFDKTEEDIRTGEFSVDLGWPGFDRALTEAVIHRDFCYRMRPYPHAREFLRELEAKYEVYICTCPWNADWAAQRYAWLKDVLQVPQERVIMTSAKHLVRGILIDDSPKNLELHPDPVIMMDRPWNLSVNRVVADFAMRVFSLEEALEFVPEAQRHVRS